MCAGLHQRLLAILSRKSCPNQLAPATQSEEEGSWIRIEKQYLLEKYGGQSEALSLCEFLILCVAEDPENLRISGSGATLDERTTDQGRRNALSQSNRHH